MKSDVILVSSEGNKIEKALDLAERTAVFKRLSVKSAIHLRLLTEEMMGLMRSITGESEGRFWIEDQDGVYELHLVVTTNMDGEKRDRLLSASTSGRNESAKGLMGRLRDFFDRNADEDVASFSNPLMLPGMFEQTSSPTLDWEWTMTRYEEALTPYVKDRQESALQAWDELEKSVVARVADEVKVSIRGRTVELIIFKRLG